MKNTQNSANRASKRSGARRLLSLLLAAVCLLACACSRGPAGNSTPAPVSEAPVSEAPSPQPAEGGRLRMAMPENLQVGNETYDPLLVSTEEALNLYSLVFEPLIAVDEANRLVPCLAINWSASPHIPNSWIINLREGVTWHSGEALTSDDVLYTWQQLCSLGDKSYYRKSISEIVSITKLDRTTLLVTTASPGMICLYSLNFPIMKRNFDVLCGTGAYRVTAYNSDRISMTVNTDWWDRPPYIKTVEFLARDSNETALASYAAGQLDLVPTALLAAGKYGDAGVTVVRDYMTQGMETLLFNHRRSMLMNIDFRMAVAQLINRSRIIANVYMGRARSCDIPVPPDSWLYDSNNRQIPYDPAGAAKLLEGCGYKLHDDGLLYAGTHPLSVTLLVGVTQDNTTRSEAAQAIAAQLAQAGITVNVVTATHGYGQTDSEFLVSLRQMNWDMALVGFNLSLSNDLEPYISALGANNYGAFPGAIFNQLLDSARAAQDEESLRNAYYELQSAFITELPFVVLYFRLNSLVSRAGLMGVSAIREPALLRNIKNWFIHRG